MNKEEALKLAKENGIREIQFALQNELAWQYHCEITQLLAFANAYEKIGMEKAAKICDELHGERNGDCADAIRAAT